MKKELTVVSYIHFRESGRIVKYDDLTEKEQKEVSERLARKAEKVKLEFERSFK